MFVSLCGATCAVILHALFRSKCTHIHCGYIDCERKVPTLDLENPTIPPDPPIDSPVLPHVRLNNNQSALQQASGSNVRDEVARLNARG
jgi:hypothetical protein